MRTLVSTKEHTAMAMEGGSEGGWGVSLFHENDASKHALLLVE